MPFVSKSQWKAAFAGYLGPKMKSLAREWAHETPSYKALPNESKKERLKKIIKKHTKIT